MHTGLVIPSLGASHLPECLAAVAKLDPAPGAWVVVLSGGADAPEIAGASEVLRFSERLGFTSAVNVGIAALPTEVEAVAVLNDDAQPDPGWLGALVGALQRNPDLAAVQGTVVDADGERIDGRGIAFDEWGLAVQIDRGRLLDEDRGERPVLAVSCTAGLFRMRALRRAALTGSEIFDHRFDSYHEDLDLGLRLHRQGSRACWVGGARTVHLGSASGPTLRWRHPWWILANRWRALAGNLSPAALLVSLPRLMRGDIRALRTLARTNLRAAPVAVAVALAMPLLVIGGWVRRSPGSRLESIPKVPP